MVSVVWMTEKKYLEHRDEPRSFFQSSTLLKPNKPRQSPNVCVLCVCERTAAKQTCTRNTNRHAHTSCTPPLQRVVKHKNCSTYNINATLAVRALMNATICYSPRSTLPQDRGVVVDGPTANRQLPAPNPNADTASAHASTGIRLNYTQNWPHRYACGRSLAPLMPVRAHGGVGAFRARTIVRSVRSLISLLNNY